MFVVTLLATLVAARAEDKAKTPAAQQFAALKKLAGDWVAVGTDGKPTEKVVSSFRVTAAGTALHETVFPGSDDEMITIYHLDGDDLILTHYCTFGNQPRMRAERDPDSRHIAFKFIGATNMKSGNEQHMDHATLTLVDADHFKAEWVALENGKTCHQETIELVRKQK
jgi:hypothetical protein